MDTKKKIVYLFLSDKPVKYRYKRKSKIVYIGKTKRNGERPFESLKNKSAKLMQSKEIKPRVKRIDVIYFEARGKQGADIVDKFERACLHEFRSYYGRLPYGNSKGNKLLELTNEDEFFDLGAIKEDLQFISK